MFPFSAVVGQDEMKLAILIAAVDPTVGGVLVFGDRGTGSSNICAAARLASTMQWVWASSTSAASVATWNSSR